MLSEETVEPLFYIYEYKCFTFCQGKMAFALQCHDLKSKRTKLCQFINNKSFC